MSQLVKAPRGTGCQLDRLDCEGLWRLSHLLIAPQYSPMLLGRAVAVRALPQVALAALACRAAARPPNTCTWLHQARRISLAAAAKAQQAEGHMAPSATATVGELPTALNGLQVGGQAQGSRGMCD